MAAKKNAFLQWTNVDQKSLQPVFSIVICRQLGA